MRKEVYEAEGKGEVYCDHTTGTVKHYCYSSGTRFFICLVCRSMIFRVKPKTNEEWPLINREYDRVLREL